MTTPAQQRGIIENVTKLELVGTEYIQSDLDRVWLLTDDDESSYPFFSSVDGVERDRVFCLANMRPKGPAEQQPKFPIDSLVEVVAAGWGLGPERIGQVLVIKGFTLRGSEPTIYHVVDNSGSTVSLSAWESSFKASVAPMPTVPPASDLSFLDDFDGDPVPVLPKAQATYTELQKVAINTFQAMYEAAAAYRRGEPSPNGCSLNGDYGICDNIDRFARASGSSESPMSEVKENFIRQTEIYSGNYTYPVPCPDGGDASSAFSRHSNKWNGPYGLNRLIQLGQLIELIKSDKWDDSMVRRKTPAFRNGLTVGDIVVYTRRTEHTYWVLRHDDESMSPSFHKIGDKDDYTDLDLNYIKKVNKADTGEKTVSEFLEELKVKQEEQKEIEKQMAALQALLAANKSAIALLDFGLADQHKVKRLS